MLSTFSVKTEPLARPESASLPHRQFGEHATHTNIQNQTDHMFITHERVILPVKEYSNKFLREGKQKEEEMCNHNILRPKKPITYTRKQLKNRKARHIKLFQNKQNETRTIKTEASYIHSMAESQQKQKERPLKTVYNALERSSSTPNSRQRISTSRALQLFSKVFKNQTIERMRIRREIISRELDVHVKQIKLGDKNKKPKLMMGAARKFNFYPCTIGHKPKKQGSFLLEQDGDFQLAGW